MSAHENNTGFYARLQDAHLACFFRPSTLLFCLLFNFLVAASLPAAHAGETTASRIGFVLPLSGDLAFLGEGIRDGAQLAREDLKQRGITVELIFEDGKGEPTQSVLAAEKLISEHRVNALVSIISSVAGAIKPLANRRHVPSIAICSDSMAADGHYNFVNYLVAAQGVAKYREHFVKAFGPGKTVGIYALQEAGFVRMAQLLTSKPGTSRPSAPASEPSVRFVEYYQKGTTDFRPVLLRHKQVQPDAFLLLGLSPEIELLARQAKSVGYSIPLTSIESFGLASDKKPFEGSWFVDSAVPPPPFRARFQHTFGRPVTPGVGHAYDSVMLLSAALGGRTGPQAAEQLRSVKEFPGLLGQLTVQPTGVIWSNASVKIIQNGEPVPLESKLGSATVDTGPQ